MRICQHCLKNQVPIGLKKYGSLRPWSFGLWGSGQPRFCADCIVDALRTGNRIDIGSKNLPLLPSLGIGIACALIVFLFTKNPAFIVGTGSIAFLFLFVSPTFGSGWIMHEADSMNPYFKALGTSKLIEDTLADRVKYDHSINNVIGKEVLGLTDPEIAAFYLSAGGDIDIEFPDDITAHVVIANEQANLKSGPVFISSYEQIKEFTKAAPLLLIVTRPYLNLGFAYLHYRDNVLPEIRQLLSKKNIVLAVSTIGEKCFLDIERWLKDNKLPRKGYFLFKNGELITYKRFPHIEFSDEISRIKKLITKINDQ